MMAVAKHRDNRYSEIQAERLATVECCARDVASALVNDTKLDERR